MSSSLKNTIIDYNSKLKQIILGQKSTSEQNNLSKNNSIFFNVFTTFTEIADTFNVINGYSDFSFSLETMDKIKNCKQDVSEIFKSKQIKSAILSKNKIIETNESMKKEWREYICGQTDTLIESLSIYYLVCNNKKGVKNVIDKINNAKNTWPISYNDIQKYQNFKLQGESLIQTKQFSKPIEEFLIKVRDKKEGELRRTLSCI